MIYRRKEGEQVKRGLNILWSSLAKGAILSTPWFSLYLDWNRHTRRLRLHAPFGFNWRAPLGPWRRIRELEAELHALDHALSQSNDRYDKIRDMNSELRRALALYRNA